MIVEDAFNNTLSLSEIELSGDQMRKLQSHFDRAVDRLVKKAQGEPDGTPNPLPMRTQDIALKK